MSELQGPRIPGEEGSRRRRPLGWIVGGLITLLLLALLIPFACQALRGGPDSQGGGSGTQDGTNAQAAEGARGGDENTGATGAGENTGKGSTGAGGSRGGEGSAAATDRAAGGGPETSGERAGGGDLPETGGTSPVVLLAAGAVLIAATISLSTLVRRRGASRG